tara:strand:- start:338 stop:1894 length:1557 start_codon:yes stop_codon:yes gene_type:complete
MSFTTLTKVGQGNGSSDLRYDFTGTSLQKTDIQVTVIENKTSWDTFSAYSTNAERSYNGNLYKATASISAGQNPPIHTTGTENNWQFLRATFIAKNLNTHYTIPTYNTTTGGTVEFIAGSDNGLTSRGFAANTSANNFTVRVERVTSSNPIVEFAAGSSIKADDLNKQNKQALFVGEDTREAVNTLAVGNPQSAFQVNGSNIVANSITTGKIDNGAIINEDINASAAIDGTKISPNFGSQNIVTTGHTTVGSELNLSSGTDSNRFFDVEIGDHATNTTNSFYIRNFTGNNSPNNLAEFKKDGGDSKLIVGKINATQQFIGNGSGLTDVPATSITAGGTLPALNGGNLTSLNPANFATGTLAAGVAITANRPAWFMSHPKAANNTDEFSVARETDTIIGNYQNNESGVYAESGISTSNGNFTVPTGRAGMYFIFVGAMLIDLDDRDNIDVFFFKNGSKLGPVGDSNSPGDNINTGASIFRLANFSDGDVIQAGVRHTHHNSSLNLQGANTFFGGFRLSV